MSKEDRGETFTGHGGAMNNLLDFCDLSCKYAAMPKQSGIDGSGSCRTFVAIQCGLKKMLVHKNMPCKDKILGKAKKKK
ncbi:MAG: hypothetical protein ACYDHW_09180 [Syntrophorhabdaceae bacterium]